MKSILGIIECLKLKIFVLFRLNAYPSNYSSHSQFGEDMVVRSLFPQNKKGVFVDIGAHHPVYYSNTFHFYRKGWRGLNIDALPGSMKLFKLMRPADKNIEQCVSTVSGQEVEFYEFSRAALNTIDKELADNCIESGEKLKQICTLQTKNINEILQSENFSAIDYLSIDIEGLDEVVLKSLDFKKFSPKVISFEEHNCDPLRIGDSELVKFLISKNYILVAKTGPSLIMKKK